MEFFVTKGFDRKKKNETLSNCKVFFLWITKKGRNELKRRTDKPITQIQLDLICWDILSKNLLRKRNIVLVALFVIFKLCNIQNHTFLSLLHEKSHIYKVLCKRSTQR